MATLAGKLAAPAEVDRYTDAHTFLAAYGQP